MSRRNLVTVFALLCVVGAMGTLVVYSVPLYQLFCRVSGYGGTTRVATAPTGHILDRKIMIRFNADVSDRLPWRFEPAQDGMALRVGERGVPLAKTRQSHFAALMA